MTAVVLGGGGNLGAIQVGQLRALAERDIVPDIVLGCSVGALNGGAYCVDPTVAGVRHLEHLWREIEADPASLMPSSWVPNSVQLLRKGPSLQSNERLAQSIRRFLAGATTFDELRLPFQCVAVDVDEGAETWFSEGPLLEPILASAALPSVYPMVEIDGRRYLDGGVLDNVPITRAVELGARTIYVLHVGLHGKPSHTVTRPVDAALIAYWIARNGRFSRDLAALPRNVNAVVLPPGTRPGIRFDDFSRTGELIDQGYEHAVAYLDSLDAAGPDDDRVDAEGRSLGARAERLRSDARRVVDELRGRVTGRSEHRAPDDDDSAFDGVIDRVIDDLLHDDDDERSAPDAVSGASADEAVESFRDA